jgi:integrase
MTKTRTRGNGSIYQQPGCSTYSIQFYGANGKRHRESTGTDDYQTAQKKLREKLSKIDKGEPIEPKRKHQITCGELYPELKRDYIIQGRKSLDTIERRWRRHLQPWFADRAARNVDGDALGGYIDHRLEEKAKPATINRELACLKTMLRIGQPKHKYILPVFPHLTENNVRTGFVEQDDFENLRRVATEPWLRLFLEMAFECGWRKRELLNLRVRQANPQTALIRLDAGETKNSEGREVTMTQAIRELVRLAIVKKGAADYVLTRGDGKPVKDFRKAWQNLCVQAGLSRWVCRACEKTVVDKNCECGGKKLKYVGRIVHDFRRSAARELRRVGVAESTIMEIGGWKTSAMFKRYAIKDPRDIAAAIGKREQARAENSHDVSHDSTSSAPAGREWRTTRLN